MGKVFLFILLSLFVQKVFCAPGDPYNSLPNPISPIQVKDIFFQQTGKVAEQSLGGFDSPQWKLGAEAKFSSNVEVKASLGASNLLYRPAWVPASVDSINLIEATALYKTSYADFYAGQVMTPWGLEGLREENEIYLPRTLFYEKGMFPLRDVGAGVIAKNDGFYFNVLLHSGVGGVGSNTQNGNRLFTTGQWGYETPSKESVGLSITEGRILNSITGLESKLRGGNLFFTFHLFSALIEAEGSYLQSMLTAANTYVDSLSWHLDMQTQASEHLNIIARYEQFNPNLRVSSNILGRGFFGFEWHDRTNFSRLFLMLVKNNESLQEFPNDELRLTWRITPL